MRDANEIKSFHANADLGFYGIKKVTFPWRSPRRAPALAAPMESPAHAPPAPALAPTPAPHKEKNGNSPMEEEKTGCEL